ncbi:MAG TPA: sigma-70 family RNA polymerase sigma factor, partial [Candidatus Dormibacteraeota bacterium]|nr:sigma-70 family RNA polymerase sigma factor [Candidatus Dormibacteraeota bacterium]
MNQSITGGAEDGAAGVRERALAGDVVAFEQLILPLVPPAHRLAYALLRDPAAAEDAVQEACLSAWDRLHQLRSPESGRSWFFAIVASRCRSGTRSRSTLLVHPKRQATDEQQGPEGSVGVLSLREFLRRLSVQDQLILYLRYVDDLTQEEIARIAGMRLGTMESHLHRALHRLRRELSRELLHMTRTGDRPPEKLREAFLLGYEAPGADGAMHLVRQALAGAAEERRSRRARAARRLAPGLAAALALLVVVTLLAVRLGVGAQHRTPPAGVPAPSSPAASEAAIVYLDHRDPTYLRQVSYDGSPGGGSWALAPAGTPMQILSASPDGQDVVRLDRRQGFQIVDAGGQVVSTVADTPGSPDFGVWSRDSSQVCQLAIRDPRLWQLAVINVRAGVPSTRVVPIASLRYPPSISIVACDPAAHRAVLVEPLTDSVPAPASAQRAALVVDLITGQVVKRVSIGDSSHGTVFSPDTRYLARIDYDRGTTSIVDLVTGKTVKVERGEVRGF